MWFFPTEILTFILKQLTKTLIDLLITIGKHCINLINAIYPCYLALYYAYENVMFIMLYILTTISTDAFFAKFVLDLVLNTSLSIISPTKVAINNILPWNTFPYWFFEVNLSLVELKLKYHSTSREGTSDFWLLVTWVVVSSSQHGQADERGFPTKVS